MRILLLSHKFYPNIGGIESISEMLAVEFIEAGHQVRVVTWSLDETKKKFSFQVVRKPNVYELIKQYLWADVVFENNPCLRLIWPNFIISKPRIIGLQTWIARVDGQISIIDRLKRQNLIISKQVIACSESIRKKNWKNAIVIGNPYKLTQFEVKSEVRRIFDFVFLGRLVSDKGADILIKAFADLNNGIPCERQYTLSIIGDGEEKQKLIKMVSELKMDKKVHFTGSLIGEELVKKLNEHKYIVVPSVWEEPFGIVALEGMACGCLPIVSDGGGLPDAVGKAGVTFRSGDVDNLVTVIRNLINNPLYESDLRNKSAEHLTVHSSTVVARKYLDIIESVVNNK